MRRAINCWVRFRSTISGRPPFGRVNRGPGPVSSRSPPTPLRRAFHINPDDPTPGPGPERPVRSAPPIPPRYVHPEAALIRSPELGSPWTEALKGIFWRSRAGLANPLPELEGWPLGSRRDPGEVRPTGSLTATGHHHGEDPSLTFAISSPIGQVSQLRGRGSQGVPARSVREPSRPCRSRSLTTRTDRDFVPRQRPSARRDLPLFHRRSVRRGMTISAIKSPSQGYRRRAILSRSSPEPPITFPHGNRRCSMRQGVERCGRRRRSPAGPARRKMVEKPAR